MSVPDWKCGHAYTLAEPSCRWAGCRFSAPAMTPDPSRWVWKKLTPSATSLPYNDPGPWMVKVGEEPVALPPTVMWYVPGAVNPVKLIGYTSG